ncbi:hypothetical protein MNBD_GAMMA10-736 [hydrothermal vent metagenome]|uniref:FecR protein domain-containing protein n=1 Tax=hydrothermal vent metagenome TaxID=652676 RepID=A0A3B0Y9V9_9ZZZZ
MQYRLNNGFLMRASFTVLIFVCLCVLMSIATAGNFNTHKRYLYVQPGQNIFSLVKVLYPGQRKQWPSIIKKIVKLNPHAFVAADASRIVVGKRLEIPAIKAKVRRRPKVKKAVVYKGPTAVGYVIKRRGKVFVLSSELKRRNLDIGSEVYVGDRIYSGVKGFVRLSMIDEAKIDLRCNSEMLIEDYQLIRGGNRSVIHLIKGSVKKITGSIGKMAEDIYEMHTPLATVGVRGTEYAIRVLQAHGCDGSVDVNNKGLFVKVKRGFIDVKTAKEERAMAVNETAYLGDKNEKIQTIDVSDGVFDAVKVAEPEKKKSHVMGSAMWLICLLPIIFILRKTTGNADRQPDRQPAKTG